MLVAATVQEGKKCLVLGLDEENITRLKNDQPIYKSLDDIGIPGLAGWHVYILGPEDMVRFVAHFGVKTE